jgi:ABC-2 type transport system ATP-binding protein
MLVVKNLVKYYASVMALDGISFEVKKGEVVGFLGPNGAGKTTAMRIITCFMPATSGEVTVDGYDVFRHSREVRGCIGYLPENVPLNGDLRVSEYLRLRARLKGVPIGRLKSHIGETMERCGIVDVRKRVIGHLSKGYKQRVGLADALLGNPRLIILDEPTVGLDPNQVRQVRDLIKSLGKGHTILLSTHYLSEVEATCKRIIIINDGRIVAHDAVQDLTERLEETVRLKTLIRGPGEEIDRVLKALPEVRKVLWEEKGEGLHAYHIEIEKGRDLREPIFHVVVQNGWVLRELYQEGMSLEEIFVRLTMEEEADLLAHGEGPKSEAPGQKVEERTSGEAETVEAKAGEAKAGEAEAGTAEVEDERTGEAEIGGNR